MADEDRSGGASERARRPHPATVSRAGTAQPKLSKKTAGPHPATVPRGAALQSKRARGAKAPDEARVVMTARKNKDHVVKKANEKLAPLDLVRLTRNWEALVLAPPHPSLSLEFIGKEQEPAFRGFSCAFGRNNSRRGHISYNAGTYRIAHVTLDMCGPLWPDKVNYWFMIDSNGDLVSAPDNVYIKARGAQPFSAMPKEFKTPVEALLVALYQGTF